jgi:hypothetical protein
MLKQATLEDIDFITGDYLAGKHIVCGQNKAKYDRQKST